MPTVEQRQPLEAPATAPPDPLAAALGPLQMNGAFYCSSELSAPWGMTLPPLPGYAWFHVISEGGCELEAEGAARTLRRGEKNVTARDFGDLLVEALRGESSVRLTPAQAWPLRRVRAVLEAAAGSHERGEDARYTLWAAWHRSGP